MKSEQSPRHPLEPIKLRMPLKGYISLEDWVLERRMCPRLIVGRHPVFHIVKEMPDRSAETLPGAHAFTVCGSWEFWISTKLQAFEDMIKYPAGDLIRKNRNHKGTVTPDDRSFPFMHPYPPRTASRRLSGHSGFVTGEVCQVRRLHIEIHLDLEHLFRRQVEDF